ncbi:MAG: hypothetical protein VX939_03790 [Pseudomonadota bacterium]|nr:hypothetical protein [Pseudomonadota bacterium]
MLFSLPFAVGGAVIAWVGAGFVGSDALALAFTGLIALVFAIGLVELVRFRRDTRLFAEALAQVPDSPEQAEPWLASLPPALYQALHKRLDGQPAALPAPSLSPYLTGLLVMLGLLGTFAGMIVTLSGAAAALDGSTDLASIRGALAAPIAGLSLAFGTSIAGVAASAMLGLAATLCRRERVLVSRRLDQLVRTVLHPLSAQYQRQQAFEALAIQSRALPEMTTALASTTDSLSRLGQQLERSLLDNQAGFYQQFHETQQRFQDSLQHTTAEQLQTLARSVADTLDQVVSRTAAQAGEAIQPVVASAMTQLKDDTSTALGVLQNETGAVARELRAERERIATQENAMLAERQRLFEAMDAALEAHHGRSEQQHQAVDALIARTSDTLASATQRFQSVLAEQSQRLTGLSEEITGSSQEVGALSDAFNAALEQFTNAHANICQSLSAVQNALDQAGQRHDEQLAYYVAQAREVLDLTVSAQQDVLGALKRDQPATSGAR